MHEIGEPTHKRRILLADADAFYVAVARLADPEGAGKAKILVVGGSSNRGVVTSASYEARAYGVRSAMPTATARRLCPEAVFVPVPRQLCSEKSRMILETLRDLSPVVEPASIDEFYLDLTGTERLFQGEDLAATARRIRKTLKNRTGLSVSIGGGSSRLIAKLAAKQAKPRPGTDAKGVLIVAAGEELPFMKRLKLADLPMIGPQFQERLASHGLKTVQDTLAVEQSRLQQLFGKKTAAWLHDRVRGLDSAPVTASSPARSLSHEETFSVDLQSEQDLQREVLDLSYRVAADLRTKGLKARTVTVKIRYSDFSTRQKSQTLKVPISADRPVLATALDLLRKHWKQRRSPIRLLGVALSQLSRGPSGPDQLSIFHDEVDAIMESDQDRTLSEVIDKITGRFGKKGIRRASQLDSKRY